MEDKPQAEHIANGFILGLHILDIDDLRSHVARSSASHEEILRNIRELRQSEVSNHALETSLISEQDVFWFEIAMHDLLGVHFLQPTKYGVNGSLDLHRFEPILRLDLVIQLSSFEQLHYNIQ